MLEAQDRELLVSHFPAWNQLTKEQRELICARSSVIYLEKGEFVQELDGGCSGVLIVKEGMMRAYTISESGKDVTYYRLKPGDVDLLSASCVLKGLNMEMYWEAMNSCQVIQILPCAFAQVMNENIHLEATCYKISTSRLSQIIVAMQYMMFNSVQERLARFLIGEIHNTQSDIILMTHEQIAQLMGTAREVVTRMLKEFAHDGIVSLERGKVIILDQSRLVGLLEN